jgi:hypothetical protein
MFVHDELEIDIVRVIMMGYGGLKHDIQLEIE